MQGFNKLRRDSNLSEREYKYFEKQVIISARQVRIARELWGTPLGPIGFGKSVYTYDELTEMGDAIISLDLEDHEDDTNLAEVNTSVPVPQNMFFIKRRQLEASRAEGRPLDTVKAESAGYKVGLKEEALLMDGWKPDGTNYKSNGFYQGAANTFAGADFATPGSAVAAVAGGMGEMLIDKIPQPYNLVLYPTQFTQLVGSIWTGGISEWTKVLEMLAGGKIYSSPQIGVGTGMMIATPNRGYFKLTIGQDILTEFFDHYKKTGTYGRVFEALVGVIYNGDSICTLTGI